MPPTRLALLISLLQGAALLLPAQRVSNPSPPATTTGATSDSAPSNSATPLPAQGTPPILYTQDGGTGASRGDAAHPHELVSIAVPPIANVPFSLTLNTNWKPPQGMVRRINNNPEYNSRRIMRDSAGRIYEERWSFIQNPQPYPAGIYGPSPLPPPSQESYIQISDPVAHTYYNCSVAERICTLTEYRGSADAIYKPDVAAHKTLPDGSVQTAQPLGSKRVEGLDAQGYRVITANSSGPAGNNGQIADGRTFWYSPQLGIDLISNVTSRASGEERFLVTHLKTADPDPKYFSPPAGYRIVDQRQSTPPVQQTAAPQLAEPQQQPLPASTLVATQSPATSPASSQSVATIQVTTRLVVLDVVVTDKQGHPVKGLKQSDFTLLADGVPQALASFTEHDASDQPPPPALPPNTFTDHAPVTNSVAMTVIVLDTSSLAWQDAGYARYEVDQYMKKVTPGTPVCIFEQNQYGLQLLQDFTTDPQLLRQAVDSKRNIQWPRHQGPILIRRGLAVKEIARYLSSFPGRKNLIWFGGGVAGGIYDPQVSAGVSYPKPSGLLFSDIDSFSADLEGATDTLTLSRVALYTVDPRGVVFNEGEELGVLQQGADLSEVASATGGKAYYNSNAIDTDVSEVVVAGSHYYTLSYTPTNTHWDGSFRNIKVQLASNGLTYLASLQPPTQLKAPLHLAYRSGYYALPNAPRRSPTSAAAGTRRLISFSPKGDPNAVAQRAPLDEAMSFGAVPPFQVIFKAHITPAPTAEKLARNTPLPEDNYLAAQYRQTAYRNYQVHYSIDPQDLQFAQHPVYSYHDTIEFIAVVYDDKGAIVNSFVNTVPIDAGVADYSRIMQTGIGIQLPIAIPAKGDFYLRLGVHDLTSDRIGALEIPVEAIKLSPPQNSPATARQTR